MILVDTSVWIDHLHKPEPALADVLARDEVDCHTLVNQELAWAASRIGARSWTRWSGFVPSRS